MPVKNSIKDYVADAFYHLYNRGVAKQPIFLDEQDYGVFLSYLKVYLEPKDDDALNAVLADPMSSGKQKDNALKLLRLNNFYDTATLVAHTLMKNHFHLCIKQKDADTIDRFMNSLCTRYTMYYNKRYKRVGPLFQSVYKAVLIRSDEQLVYLTRYIHRNIIEGKRKDRPTSHMLTAYPYSSYPEYMGIRQTSWIHPEIALSFFKGYASYQAFVEDDDASEKQAFLLKSCLLDA